MKILLFGPNGQVGWELQRSLAVLGRVVPLARQAREGCCADLSRPECIVEAMGFVDPDLVVNAAAYTNVDQAEFEPDLAWTINAQDPGIIGKEAKKRAAAVVHYI
jgi:dTDP-4-dehydrorhamnose reductase